MRGQCGGRGLCGREQAPSHKSSLPHKPFPHLACGGALVALHGVVRLFVIAGNVRAPGLGADRFLGLPHHRELPVGLDLADHHRLVQVVALGGGKFDAYVNWLCILDEQSALKMPDGLFRWRQLGLGTLLLVALIKAMAYLYDEQPSKEKIAGIQPNFSIHLQCTKLDKKAFAFYKKLGFQDMDGEKNAFDQLPAVIKDFLNAEDKNHHFFILDS